MFLLVLAHPGCAGQIPESHKTVVCYAVAQRVLNILSLHANINNIDVWQHFNDVHHAVNCLVD